MIAKVRKEGEAFIIHLSGKVDFDSSEPFRQTVMDHLRGSSVIFNMKDLNFVGSNGITPFVETMRELCLHNQTQVRFCYLSSEFEKIFEANQIDFGVNFLDEHQAMSSIFHPSLDSISDFEESSREAEVQPEDPLESLSQSSSRVSQS